MPLFPGDRRGPAKHRDAELFVLLKLPPISGPAAPPAALSQSQFLWLAFAFKMVVTELRNEVVSVLAPAPSPSALCPSQHMTPLPSFIQGLA